MSLVADLLVGSLDATRYAILAITAFMALGAVVVVILKLANPQPKQMMTEHCWLVPWLSYGGILAFLVGMGMFGLPAFGDSKLPLLLFVGGWLAVGASILLNALTAKTKRKSWPVVFARCIDRTLISKLYSENRAGWLWRVVCELNYEGKRYVVTPKVRWSDTSQMESPFWSEQSAREYIANTISASGTCKLRINPRNLSEAELID